MSPLWPSLCVVAGAVFALLRLARGGSEGHEGVVRRSNYAGVEVPVTLGRVLVLSAQAAVLLCLGLALLAGPVADWPLAVLLAASARVLQAVGAMDDRHEHGPRGIRGHVETLLHGRVTTGIVKLVVGVAAAVSLATVMGGGVPRVVVATLVVALSVNVTNAFDVRPGRALKWSLLILIPTGAAAWGSGVGLVLLAYVGAGIAVLRPDLLERGMLGDAGSNPLGLVAGTGLAAVLPDWGLLVALGALAGLQVAAETVTISKLIEETPPFRWLDALGRKS